MKIKAFKKGPAIILLLMVATAFIGLGIFLDGEVLPTPSLSKNFLKRNISKTSDDSSPSPAGASDQPSEIAQQLKRAIDAANRSESDESEKLAQSISTSEEKISETSRLLEEKGFLPATGKSSEKSEAFSRRLESLKARLATLQSPNK